MKSRKNKKRIKKITKEVIKQKKIINKFLAKNDTWEDSMELPNLKNLDIIPSPFQIAEFYGLKLKFIDIDGNVPSYINKKNFTIYISNKYRDDDYAARHLCAHELGHFFLHKKFIAEMNIFVSKEIEEYEANIFSILLMPQIMGGEDWERLEPKDLNNLLYNKVFKKIN